MAPAMPTVIPAAITTEPISEHANTYTDILLSPEEYVGTAITMSGDFYYKNTERKSFDLKQGDDTIEVFYEDLPEAVQGAILSQKNFSKTTVNAEGVLRRFSNSDNSFYIMAEDVSL